MSCVEGAEDSLVPSRGVGSGPLLTCPVRQPSEHPSLHLDSAWRLWLQNKRYPLLLATND